MSKIEKKENVNEKKPIASKMRQIVLETNGSDIKIVKAEVSGSLEFIAILEKVITYINKNAKQ